MRGPQLAEAVFVIATAALVGVVMGATRARGQGPSGGGPADDGLPETNVAAADAGATIEAEDASVSAALADAESDGGSRVYTVDDDQEPEPPEPSVDPDVLLSMIPLAKRDEASLQAARKWVGAGTNHANQGNPTTTKHPISRAECREKLKGVPLQTDAQRAQCGGPWEVPIHTGDPSKATACIDVFEYPNRPCVLPMVFSYAIMAKQLCALAGKRLCTQEEWNTACEADPGGGPPSKYAYGDTLNLEICNTGRPKSPRCDVDNGLWKTCPTETVPAGSFPQCRSRLGVFDQHGNIAEAMTRMEKGVNYVQLKGSAFFYDGEMYADHCRYDPRWHVDPVDESWHTNYHLGFRCCRTIGAGGDAGADASDAD